MLVLIDESLLRFGELYTAAGTPDSMVRLDRSSLVSMTGGRVARISR